MSRYWSDLVSALTPYVPGEQPQLNNLIKLNTNENPYPPSPQVMRAIASVTADELRRYPDPESQALQQAFARHNGLQPDQVFIGNGSDEVLALSFMALLKHSEPLYFPDVSYSFYPVWAELAGISYREVPVADDFSIEISAFPESNGGIIIPNPNAPTGMLMALDTIRSLLQKSVDSVVVIDEAYIDFGGDSAAGLIEEFDNLLVVQTLSKSASLAGLRVGAAMGNTALIEALQRVKNSFNSYPLDVIAQRAALASLSDPEYFQQNCQRIVASRERLIGGLRDQGFEVLPSAANFIFATHPLQSAKDLFHALRERGIIVRYFDKPRLRDYLRISVGTEEECRALLDALRELLL